MITSFSSVFGQTLNPSSADPTKQSNTLKTVRRLLPTNCLSVLDHFVGFALKGLICINPCYFSYYIGLPVRSLKVAVSRIFFVYKKLPLILITTVFLALQDLSSEVFSWRLIPLVSSIFCFLHQTSDYTLFPFTFFIRTTSSFICLIFLYCLP